MKNLIANYFVATILLCFVADVKAQELISLEETMMKANRQAEQVKKEILDIVDIFASPVPGILREVIEKSKGQGSLYMSSVVIKGNINFQDLSYLTTIVSINKLDLSQANIIGDKLRSPNVFPSGAFSDLNTQLKELVLPMNLVAIDQLAFAGLSKLEEVDIPGGCRVIGERAFSNIPLLKLASLPEGVMFIDDYAFAGSGIIGITLPSSIKSIGRNAFQGTQLRYFSSEKVRECSLISDKILADCQSLEFAGFHYRAGIFGKKILENTPSLKVLKLESSLPPYLMDNSLLRLNKYLKIQVPEGTLNYYLKKRIWRKLAHKYVISKTDLIKQDLYSNNSLNDFVRDNSKMCVTDSINSLIVPHIKGEHIIEIGEPIQSNIIVDSLVVVTTRQVVDSIRSDRVFDNESMKPMPSKVYWLTGKLYVESQKSIRIANLITLDNIYVYGRAETDKIWSFKIDISKVSSVRISFIDSDVPEIIRMKK